MTIPEAIRTVKAEVDRANFNFPEFRSSHEGAAIIKEEWDEFWEEVKKDDISRACEEVTQLAAMCVKYLTKFGE